MSSRLTPIPEFNTLDHFNDEVDRKIEAYLESARVLREQREKMKKRRSQSAVDVNVHICDEDCSSICTQALSKTSVSQILINLMQNRVRLISSTVNLPRDIASAAVNKSTLDDTVLPPFKSAAKSVIGQLTLSIASEDEENDEIVELGN
jgi:hypothetical protein